MKQCLIGRLKAIVVVVCFVGTAVLASATRYAFWYDTAVDELRCYSQIAGGDHVVGAKDNEICFISPLRKGTGGIVGTGTKFPDGIEDVVATDGKVQIGGEFVVLTKA